MFNDHRHSVETRALETIAVFEALKGGLAVAASVGLLSLLHHDVRSVIRQVIEHMGLHPDAHYPMMIMHYADVLQNTNFRMLLLMATGYASLRFLEAYGIWRDKAWGQWLGALSGAIYIPFEIRHVIHRPSVAGLAIMMANVLVVAILASRLYRRRRTALPTGQ